jgi:crotonobetaine/carnitine-CoA ligase
VPIDRHLVLPHRLADLAAERPDLPAMIDVGGRSLTWARFHDANLRWAAAYRAAGVGAGDTVVTMLPNSFEAYHAWIGAAWLRAIEVPANNMYRGHMLQYLLNDSDATVLVIAERFVDRLELVAGDVAHLRTVVVPDASGPLPELPFEVVRGDELLASVEPADDLAGPEVWDTAALIYTSGTTGPSKGVVVPWGELFQSPMILPDDFVEPGDPYYTMYPAFHLSGKCGLYNAAHTKSHLVVREALSITEFWDDIRRYEVRSAGLLGPIAAMLMTMPARDDDADNPLERVVMGPIIPNIDDFKARFGVKHVTTGFGMTEIGFPIAAPWDPPNPRTCGRRREGPPHFDIKIVDEHDIEVPVGTVGELLVRAYDPWVMNVGYWKAPEHTARAWRNGWFHTGDAFVEDEDGWLYFVDRMKDSLRRRGENISSFEVEAGVLQHPAVAEVAVVGVPSDLGEDEVKAVIVRHADQPLTPEELIEFLVPRMPRFMIPRYVEFVDALPKTDGTFRVRKVELRETLVTAATWDREAAGVVIPKD